MLELFNEIKCLLVNDPVRIDNVVFRLYTRVTVLFLASCSALLTFKTYFGNPINCFISTNSQIPKEAINSFCWVTSTAIVAEKTQGIRGIDNVGLGMRPSQNDSDLIEQQYYKWVCLFLGLQALMFYIPRALWIVWERNIISFLAKDLATPLPQVAWTEEKRNHLTNYFTNANLYSNNFYAIRFFICELLNLLNSICQIYFLDLLLNGQFSLLGPASVTFATAYDTTKMIDPLKQLFPLTGKCSMNTYGSSGTIQKHDAFCILSLNMINEKVFLILWFWLIILCILGTITIIYRIVMFAYPWARIYLLQAQIRSLERKKIENVVRKLYFGDWFILYQLAENVNPVVFKELVDQLNTKAIEIPEGLA
ncbi:innexin inx2-like [Leptopilina boulardi]|uniref:innexin inx2-like n=1 Tax=Leptopilina boulardi TaxID=63433 RepID=UPI0021F544F5|nr:innexin inx2-like [Leptopilina boulardi]XP_051168212.1 innexin inx2-like [Leptopilina boulardi]